MKHSDKTQMVTVRVQVPTFSAKVAAQKYLPQIIDAIEKADESGASTMGMTIRGASVGTVR